MLWTCGASTDRQLTTTAAVALDLYGTTVISTSELQRLDALITRASRWAESVVGYPLAVAIYGETLPAYGGRTLQVSRTPIRGLARLFNATSTDTATDYTTKVRIEDAGAGIISLDLGFPNTEQINQHLTPTPPPAPMDAERPWYVVYEAGYVFDGRLTTEGGTTSTGRTLPEDIEGAIISKVTETHQGAAGVQSKSVGDLSITYATYQRGIDSPAESLLAPYRRFA